MKPSHRSRAERKEQAKADCDAQHKIWLVKLQEFMNEFSCSAIEALEKLKEFVKAGAAEVPPSFRLQYKQCWLEFKRKIEEAKK